MDEEVIIYQKFKKASNIDSLMGLLEKNYSTMCEIPTKRFFIGGLQEGLKHIFKRNRNEDQITEEIVNLFKKDPKLFSAFNTDSSKDQYTMFSVAYPIIRKELATQTI